MTVTVAPLPDIITPVNLTEIFSIIYDCNGTYCYNETAPAHNGTNTTDTAGEANMFILPWWRQLLWSILFSGIVIVGTGGNIIVVFIVLAHKRMRTVTNYFIVNLSIADAMVSMLNVTFNYIYMLNSDWPFGTAYCKISQFVAVLSICASVFTLMAISIDSSVYHAYAYDCLCKFSKTKRKLY